MPLLSYASHVRQESYEEVQWEGNEGSDMDVEDPPVRLGETNLQQIMESVKALASNNASLYLKDMGAHKQHHLVDQAPAPPPQVVVPRPGTQVT